MANTSPPRLVLAPGWRAQARQEYAPLLIDSQPAAAAPSLGRRSMLPGIFVVVGLIVGVGIVLPVSLATAQRDNLSPPPSPPGAPPPPPFPFPPPSPPSPPPPPDDDRVHVEALSVTSSLGSSCAPTTVLGVSNVQSGFSGAVYASMSASGVCNPLPDDDSLAWPAVRPKSTSLPTHTLPAIVTVGTEADGGLFLLVNGCAVYGYVGNTLNDNVQSASSVWPVVLPDGTFAESVSCGPG